MEGKISDSNKKILNKLLNENIKKSKIDRVIKDEVEMSQVKKFMFERYLILENTFRTVSTVTETYSSKINRVCIPLLHY